MKKLLSLLMICSVLGSTTYSNKAEAGVLLSASGIAMVGYFGYDRDDDGLVDKKVEYCYEEGACTVLDESNSKVKINAYKITGMAMGAAGLMTTVFFGGSLALGGSFGPLPVMIALLILEEDGSLSHEQTVSMLSEKYRFLDNESASVLASAIKEKADKMELKEDKKFVSLSADEVKSILAPTDLNEEEILLVAEGLK